MTGNEYADLIAAYLVKNFSARKFVATSVLIPAAPSATITRYCLNPVAVIRTRHFGFVSQDRAGATAEWLYPTL